MLRKDKDNGEAKQKGDKKKEGRKRIEGGGCNSGGQLVAAALSSLQKKWL